MPLGISRLFRRRTRYRREVTLAISGTPKRERRRRTAPPNGRRITFRLHNSTCRISIRTDANGCNYYPPPTDKDRRRHWCIRKSDGYENRMSGLPFRVVLLSSMHFLHTCSV